MRSKGKEDDEKERAEGRAGQRVVTAGFSSGSAVVSHTQSVSQSARQGPIECDGANSLCLFCLRAAWLDLTSQPTATRNPSHRIQIQIQKLDPVESSGKKPSRGWGGRCVARFQLSFWGVSAVLPVRMKEHATSPSGGLVSLGWVSVSDYFRPGQPRIQHAGVSVGWPVETDSVAFAVSQLAVSAAAVTEPVTLCVCVCWGCAAFFDSPRSPSPPFASGSARRTSPQMPFPFFSAPAPITATQYSDH